MPEAGGFYPGRCCEEGLANRIMPPTTAARTDATPAFRQIREEFMAGHAHLFIPGPTNIPEAVRQAMNIPMEDMRAPSFPSFTLRSFRGRQEGLQERDRPRLHLPFLGHRRLGIGDHQHAQPWRPGTDVALRPVLASVGRHGGAVRPRRRCDGCRMGRRRSGRNLRGEACRRQGAPDQGGVLHA